MAVTTLKRAVVQQRETGSLEHYAWWAEHQGQELGVRVLRFPSRLGVLTKGVTVGRLGTSAILASLLAPSVRAAFGLALEDETSSARCARAGRAKI